MQATDAKHVCSHLAEKTENFTKEVINWWTDIRHQKNRKPIAEGDWENKVMYWSHWSVKSYA